ncbi:integrase arm-type DNA-binding domain-containing protein [Aquamicrobium sp.]|uniref:tyrosine-type recombinase/integrase n=1 Tax=Aquamicrobium sp. TaxID=1872579 RepID=UPI00258D28B7|nr:integrase arm-type DNA-binding domain-containing protein [Aquamicrobium sp.]MCK9553493.1 tyrosine-type recombinase/integrase [Aquamicrobium sp.]
MALTVKQIEGAKPKEKPYKISDGAGLYLYIAPTGTRSWRANYQQDGKQKTRTYGRYPAMTLAQARMAHAETKVSGNASASGSVPTFEAVAKAWLRVKLPSLSNSKHQLQVANTLERFVYPFIGSTPIDQIKRPQLVEIVVKAQEGGRVETAHRVAGRITAVFDYAQDMGTIEHHGASGLARVLQARKVKKPMASISPEDTGQLLSLIDDYDEPVTRLGLQLLALTFVRVGELRGMRWDELREDGAVWVIPAERMKLRLPHVVPLSRQARAVIEQLRLLSGEGDLVLDSPVRRGHPVSENTFLFALYRLGYRGRMTAHGFRSLASTVLNERSGFERDVIERQLAHRETDAVRAAYNRAQYLSQRRDLMQWWADWLDQQRAGHQRASA